MRTFTQEELKKFNGLGNPAYVAYKGKVYDVTSSDVWMMGSHQGQHLAGYDLTDAMKDAPHGEEKEVKQCARPAARIIQRRKNQRKRSR